MLFNTTDPKVVVSIVRIRGNCTIYSSPNVKKTLCILFWQNEVSGFKKTLIHGGSPSKKNKLYSDIWTFKISTQRDDTIIIWHNYRCDMEQQRKANQSGSILPKSKTASLTRAGLGGGTTEKHHPVFKTLNAPSSKKSDNPSAFHEEAAPNLHESSCFLSLPVQISSKRPRRP